MRHILSVDVEDYFQVEAFSDIIPRDSWERWETRVVKNTLKILEIFEGFGVRATFFFVGWIAEKFPELVREVHRRGHELGCHSYWHRPVFTLSPSTFRSDLRQNRDVLEQISGERVLGYRAPSWSITKQSLWALEILAEEGFAYDSSIYPIRHDIYGIPGAARFPYRHQQAGQLPEFPPTTIRFAGLNLPAAGGGYLRICPVWYTEWAFRQAARCKERVVVYLHPWEIDPEQPRIPGAKLRSRFRHYTNLRGMEERISRLLRKYAFQSFADLLSTVTVKPAQQIDPKLAGAVSGASA